LVETIKSLQRYVLSYKSDNGRIMKVKEQQGVFNIKLLEILDRIKNKMDKGTELSKSKSHRSHDKKEEYISIDRHPNHSPRHSVRS
jgi:hypothetical protein